MYPRGSGVLLHITSLLSEYGIGDFGPSAYHFADFLVQTKQRYWQVLPLNPIEPIYGNSPYSSNSAFAGNIYLINPEILAREGLLSKDSIEPVPLFPNNRCDYENAITFKQKLLNQTFDCFKTQKKNTQLFDDFCSHNAWWLEDYALFAVIKKCLYSQVWSDWPQELAGREEGYLRKIKEEYAYEVEKEKFFQYLFFTQWSSLKNYCNEKRIQIIGDIPIYVSYDSADVWANNEIFKLDKNKKPSHIAGVPPDYFCKIGQLWGNPVYSWDVLEKTGYKWWVARIIHNLSLFNIIRIDHFRGLVAYWEVPAGEQTAINGKWVNAPAEDFLNTLSKHSLVTSIIAEDLGFITPDVLEILHYFEITGMKVLLFAFGEDNPTHPYLPHTYERNCVAYTGTHDNNTIRGWFQNEASHEDKKRVFRYIGREVQLDRIHWEFIRMGMQSVANIVIFPMQDILGLGEEARMNKPSVGFGNWEWRLLPGQITTQVSQTLLEMTETYGRA